MSSALPPLPASVLRLLERDHAAAVEQYRRDQGLPTAPAAGQTAAQVEPAHVEPATTTQERKRARRGKP